MKKLNALLLFAIPSLATAAELKERPGMVVTDKRFADEYQIMNDPKGICVGCRFERIVGTVGRRGFRSNADDVTFRQINVELIAPRSYELPVGIDLQAGSNILIEDSVARNFRMLYMKGKYTNGDGFSCEGAAKNVTFRRVSALHNSDGGFDLKCLVRLDDTRAEDNGRNYRFWGTATAGTITSVNPRKAHIWLSPGANVTIDLLVAASDKPLPLIDAEDGAPTITVKACRLKLPAGTPLVAGKAVVSLGPGCKL